MATRKAAPDAEPAAAGAPSVARFEAALGELEQVVTQLERGELKLEESLQLFERGVALTRECRSSLDSAELKVKALTGGEKPADAG